MIARAFRIGWTTAVLCFMAYCLWGLVRDSRELRKWTAEARALEKAVGNLEVSDASKIHVLQVTNQGPGDLKWRLALPGNQSWKLSYHSAIGGGGSSSWGPDREPWQMLLHARILEIDGRWLLYVSHSHGHGTNGLSKEVGEFISTHWDELDVETVGEENQAVFPLDQVVSVVTIRVPKSLLGEVERELGPYAVKRLTAEPLLQIEFGTQAAFQNPVKTLTPGQVTEK